MNIAKNAKTEKIIVVEGYMDAISLHQRGISNVVASCGTALTEAQGRLLRKYAQKIIISYDSDSAGQTATIRGLEILTNLGCDVRILQMEGAKDPDEYVIKYGNGRFNNLVEEAISLIEFKVKMLKNNLNIENTNDKIKFLNEIAKLLETVDNRIEQEIYVDKISKDYKISKEAIFAQMNKISYSKNAGKKILERKQVININKQKEKVSPATTKREKIIIYLMINGDKDIIEIIKKEVKPNEIINEQYRNIIEKIYENNNNIKSILDLFQEEEQISLITEIMANDYEIKDEKKALEDIINIYQKDRLTNRKNEIIKIINNQDEKDDNIVSLEKELQDIIVKLAQKK